MCGTEITTIPCEITGRIIHALSYFVQGMSSRVYLSNRDRTVSAKSIIGLLSLGINKGDSVQVSVLNDDTDTGNEELKKIVDYMRKMGEADE